MSSANDFRLADPAIALRALLAAMPGFVYFMDAEGRYGHVTEGGAAILGLTPQQMFGRTWTDVGLPAEREAEFTEERLRVMRTGEPSQRRVSFVLGGRSRHFDLAVSAVYDDDRTPIGVVITSRDVTETVMAEARLQEESQFRRAIEQSIAAGVIAVDLDGVQTYASDAFANMVGWSVEELTGIQAPYVYWPPEELSGFRAQFAGAMEGELPSAYEVRLRRKNEERFPALIQPRQMLRDGRFAGWVALIHDLTNQRDVEERLRVSEIRYRELANSMPQIVWTARADGTADYYNDRWYEYTGMERGEHDAARASAYVHPDDLGEARRRWAVAIRDKTPYESENRYRNQNGEYRWFLARALPIRNAAGEVVRWYGTSTDIDEQKRNEAELAEDRATAEFLTRANDLFSQSLDYETTLASLANMVVPVIAEWCAVDMIENGKIRRLAVAHEDPEKVALAYDFQKRYPATLEDGGAIANIVRTGKIEWIANITDEMLAASVSDPERLAILRQLELRSYIAAPIVIRGDVVGVLTLIGGSSRARFDERDVWMASELTQRAAHAIENARLYAEAVDANRVKDEFLATLSHELRTPLTAILGWARILRMGGLDPDTTKIAIETIESSATAQSALIDDILDVSRIMAGKFQLSLANVDAREVIQNAVASMRPAADAKGVAVDVSVPGLPMEVHGDANRLQQIVWNLVSNAVKFTAIGGRVAVRVARAGDDVAISVTDTGRGIPPEFLPHVFERFRQFDSSTTRQFGGLGLGLSIVRHLAELHGGSVSAASAGEGRGATFTVRLPAARGVAPAETPEPDVDATAELRRRLSDQRVLVVDDDPGARAVLSMMLRQFGVRVVTAESVADAVRCLIESEFDLVVSDVAMPGEDGYVLIRRIRAGEAGRADVPVVAVTALADTGALRKAGFDSFLQKPVEPQALAAAVAEHLRGTEH